jgi:hypothetical protein
MAKKKDPAVEEDKDAFDTNNPKQMLVYDHKPRLKPEEILSVHMGYNNF